VGRTLAEGRLEEVEHLIQDSFIFLEPWPSESHYVSGLLWYRSGRGHVGGPPDPGEIKADQVVE
jgi:hypothetical protein